MRFGKFALKATATQIIAAGFALVIFVGALLLMLPTSSATGVAISPFDALFIATSGACVTGLSVLDVGTHFSVFGQIVLLLLIQVGGLGFMAVTTLFQLAAGRRIGLRERMILKESLNEDGVGGMVKLMRWALASTFAIELAGALLLATRFVPLYGPIGLYYAVFHSVSAYCNAGFDLIGLGQSYLRFQQDPVVLIATMLLVVSGGVGFAVQRDVCRSRFHFRKFRLHTKVVLTMTVAMILGGAAFLLAAEWSNPGTFGGMTLPAKGLNALFQSVTLRTAGFAAVDQSLLTNAGKLFGAIWMFIGAAPASTGGGVKVTTFAILLLLIRSMAQGKGDVSVYKRTIPSDLVRRAVTLAMICLCALMASTLLLCVTEPDRSLADVLYLCTSALATVGLSPFDCAQLTGISRAALIALMFAGRVGPVTLMLALARRQNSANDVLRYPEDRMMIG